MSDKIYEYFENLEVLFIGRNSKYGNAYKKHGKMMISFFPDGIILRTEEDFTRFFLFSMVAGKMNRYTTQFKWRTQ